MVVVDRAARFGGGLLDRGDHLPGLRRGLRPGLPARADPAPCAGSPPRTSRRSTSANRAAPASARSRRRAACNARRRNRPCPRDHNRRITSSPSSVLRPRVFVVQVTARPIWYQGSADTEGRSRRPFDRKSIVAHCRATSTASRIANDNTLTPNLIRLRAPGERRQRAHAFEKRRRADAAGRSARSNRRRPASHRSTQRQ